ncbi:hypothetical protein HMPREF0860_0090 [Treponema socranskii subsp. socranskii VPI DR56BR1116 = ATCC 35536]|uniref:Uncharacterized protein n=1 Tax=Treponema socranskii subsp. socranskii VPI DR56BR1116 = ATCC 35536 TaxID=1125725 RepID=A0ABP2YLA5_TRESO|nr:hypothetical protein HMPREF0860_0090 [Treponema socranskii subsp. socranskii VPI DR56BR1116 = ATCC 35536]
MNKFPCAYAAMYAKTAAHRAIPDRLFRTNAYRRKLYRADYPPDSARRRPKRMHNKITAGCKSRRKACGYADAAR